MRDCIGMKAAAAAMVLTVGIAMGGCSPAPAGGPALAPEAPVVVGESKAADEGKAAGEAAERLIVGGYAVEVGEGFSQSSKTPSVLNPAGGSLERSWSRDAADGIDSVQLFYYGGVAADELEPVLMSEAVNVVKASANFVSADSREVAVGSKSLIAVTQLGEIVGEKGDGSVAIASIIVPAGESSYVLKAHSRGMTVDELCAEAASMLVEVGE